MSRRRCDAVAASRPQVPAAVVRIESFGHLLIVQPFHPELYKLQTTAIREVGGAGPGRQLAKLSVPLYEFVDRDGEPAAVLPGGLDGVVRELFRRAGVPVELHQRDSVSDAPPTGPVTPVAAAAAGRRRLLVEAAGPELAAGVVAELVAAWPAGPTVVAVKTNAAARGLAAGLRARGFAPVVGGDLPGSVGPQPTLAVATFDRLAIGAVDLGRTRVLVCPDALEAVGEVARRVVREARRARVVGILNKSAAVADPDRDAVVGLFGSGRVNVLRPGTVVRPVAVARLPFGHGLVVHIAAPRQDVWAAGVWRHPVRNRLLAAVARALADRPETLGRFPAVAAARPHGSSRVVVLVEGPDHLAALAPLLPGWPRLDARALAGDLGQAAVATAAAGWVAAWADVVVRGDAGAGLPPGLAADALAASDPRPLLVVDLADRHHPLLRRAAADRGKAYAAAGWAVDGADPAAADLDRILSYPGATR